MDIKYVRNNDRFFETSNNMMYLTFTNSYFCNNIKDTGIYVYEPTSPRSREHNIDLFYENVRLRTDMLKDILHINYKLKFETKYYGTDVVGFDDPTADEAFTQFWFHFCNARQGIYLERLTLPSHLIRKGIGTFCVNWLKDFASDLGFKYIILGSVDAARVFWIKMGFRLLTPEELCDFPGYQGRYNY